MSLDGGYNASGINDADCEGSEPATIADEKYTKYPKIIKYKFR